MIENETIPEVKNSNTNVGLITSINLKSSIKVGSGHTLSYRGATYLHALKQIASSRTAHCRMRVPLRPLLQAFRPNSR